MKHITLLLALCLLIVSFAGCQSAPGLTLETKPPEEQADPTPGAPSPEKPGTEEGNENEENKENNENEENKKDPDPNAGVKLDKASLSLLVGEGAVLVATCTHPYPDTVCDLHYSISHESIAHIDQNGAVTAKQAGSATITATCGEYSASCALTVSRKENENAGIHVSNQSIDLRVGASQGLGATLTPKYEGDDTTITYKTDNASVASVSESGLVTAIGKGSCTITLTGGGFTLQIAVTVRAKTSENSFSFLAAGDNLLHSGIYNDARLRAGGSGYDFSGIYKAIADKVKNADFSMINQETVFTGASPSSYPSLNAPQQAVKALADLGFDIISLANNHCLDKGGDGLAKSMTYLDSLKTV